MILWPFWFVAPEDLSEGCDLLVSSLRWSCFPIKPSFSSCFEDSAAIFFQCTLCLSVPFLNSTIYLMMSTYITRGSKFTVHYALCKMLVRWNISVYDGADGTSDVIVKSSIICCRSTSLLLTRSCLISKHELGMYAFTNVSKHVFKIRMCLPQT